MGKLQPDVWRLLKCNISKGQLVGYMAANIVGLAVVLIGVLFFSDTRPGSGESDSFFSDDYVVVSKKVSGIGFTPANFTEEEISELGRQPWVRKVGRFTSSQFSVNGSVNLGGRGLSTYMFFESVPDEFFDIKPRDWDFDPEERYVPVILNKEYLSLYNYGFAVPQGLPQVSEEVIGAIPFILRITGESGQPEYFEASVVGFSSRLNTIAVPQSFMDWANRRYAPGAEMQPSRLILQVDRLKAEDMERYCEEAGLEVSGDNDSVNAVSSFLAVVSSVVTTNGLVISLLAIFILILSIFLMLQKSRAALRNLMLLGYSPSEVGMYYNLIIVTANMVVAVLALAIAMSARGIWTPRLHELDLGAGSVLPAIAVLVAYVVVVTVVDLAVVRTHILRIWRG